MKKLTFCVAICCMSLLMSCCASKPQPKPQQKQEVEKHNEPVREVRTVRSDSCDTCTLASLVPQAPAEAALGQNYETSATVTALDDTSEVIVTTAIPEGASYVRSEPDAANDGSRLSWRFPWMNRNDTRTIKVWLTANREGDIALCYGLIAHPRYCVVTKIGKPGLHITKDGPSVAQIGDEFSYNIVVSNPGSSPARDVVVTDNIPDGLEPVDGNRTPSFQVGDLNPGESKNIDSVRVRATRTGTFTNVATATSSNAGQVSDDAVTVVQSKSVSLTVTCDPDGVLGKPGRASMVIRNTGDTALTGVVVTAEFGGGMKFRSASCEFQEANGVATWNIGNLGAGEEKPCDLVTVAKSIGKHCMTVTVRTAEGLSKSEQCCTEWRGMAAILLEVIDTEDPLLIGEETTYVIQVTNQGNAADGNIKIVATFPGELDPVSVEGATQGTIDGKNINFEAYPVLQPKQKIEWRMRAKGVAPGDGRLRVLLSSDLAKTPIPEEESTNIY